MRSHCPRAACPLWYARSMHVPMRTTPARLRPPAATRAHRIRATTTTSRAHPVGVHKSALAVAPCAGGCWGVGHTIVSDCATRRRRGVEIARLYAGNGGVCGAGLVTSRLSKETDGESCSEDLLAKGSRLEPATLRRHRGRSRGSPTRAASPHIRPDTPVVGETDVRTPKAPQRSRKNVCPADERTSSDSGVE